MQTNRHTGPEQASVCEKGQTADSDGPHSGCISARTTLGSKSLSVFEDKGRHGKAHASENIERAKTEDVDAA